MPATRQLISSGGPFETRAGYSRAVRVGDVVAVAGIAAYKDGAPHAPGDAGAQTRYILEVLARALTEAGSSLDDVIRYRVYVTNIPDFPEVGAELGKVFAGIRPAGTLVEVSALVDPALVVEIEVDAIVGSAAQSHPTPEPVNPDDVAP